jgi:hypothetical protein
MSSKPFFKKSLKSLLKLFVKKLLKKQGSIIDLKFEDFNFSKLRRDCATNKSKEAKVLFL